MRDDGGHGQVRDADDRAHRVAGRRGRRQPGPAMDHHRLERSDQPDELRHLRVPEAVRLHPRQGAQADARRPREGSRRRVVGHSRADGDRRRATPRGGALGDVAAGRLTVSSVKRRGQRVIVRLDTGERSILAGLLGAVRTLLAPDDEDAGDADPLAAVVGMTQTPVDMPDDPVLLRLLPDAYGDPEQSAEFRRLTDSELRTGKTAAIDRVLADLASERIELDLDEGVGMWLQALNDVRLVLGTRLDVTEDWGETVAELPTDDPRLPLYALYDWLSVLQETLVLSATDD